MFFVGGMPGMYSSGRWSTPKEGLKRGPEVEGSLSLGNGSQEDQAPRKLLRQHRKRAGSWSGARDSQENVRKANFLKKSDTIVGTIFKKEDSVTYSVACCAVSIVVLSCPNDAPLLMVCRQIYGEQSFVRMCFSAKIFYIIFYGVPCLLVLYSLINKRVPCYFLQILSFPWLERTCRGHECEYCEAGAIILFHYPFLNSVPSHRHLSNT